MADITVRKANVVLDIPEEQKDEYLSKGYDVISARGVVIEAATPQDVPTLQAKLAELSAENKKLKAMIAELQAKPKKVETPKLEEPVVEEKPKKAIARAKKTK